MKSIKCSEITAEVFGEERKFYAPLNATIGDVMTALKSITETAHFVRHGFSEVDIKDYESALLYRTPEVNNP